MDSLKFFCRVGGLVEAHNCGSFYSKYSAYKAKRALESNGSRRYTVVHVPASLLALAFPDYMDQISLSDFCTYYLYDKDEPFGVTLKSYVRRYRHVYSFRKEVS